MRGSATRAAPRRPSPGSSCSASDGTPAACSRRVARAATSGVSLGRLGQHRIARRQRRRDLAGEDRQREVPRADAHHRPQRRAAQRRAAQHRADRRRPVRAGAQPGRVVAQEVDRLAHLADRRRRGLAGLAHDRRQQLRQRRLHPVGGVVQDARALRVGPRRPALPPRRPRPPPPAPRRPRRRRGSARPAPGGRPGPGSRAMGSRCPAPPASARPPARPPARPATRPAARSPPPRRGRAPTS